MLVDTSVWIDFLNGHESAAAVRLTRAITDGESIALTGPILTEVLIGLKDSATAQKVAYLLDAFAMPLELDRAGVRGSVSALPPLPSSGLHDTVDDRLPHCADLPA